MEILNRLRSLRTQQSAKKAGSSASGDVKTINEAGASMKDALLAQSADLLACMRARASFSCCWAFNFSAETG